MLQRSMEDQVPEALVRQWEPATSAGCGTTAVALESCAAVSSGLCATAAAVADQPNHYSRRLRELRICPCPPWKRTMDIAGAIVGLAVLWPLMLAIALYIKLVCGGPVFFRHQRYGLAGRPFLLWKFRTIKQDAAPERHRSHVNDLMASDQPLEKIDDELPVIPGGRFLRRLGLDELPQLFNVLTGEMSLVGPRPDVVPFDSYRAWQQRRFDVVPGITGLWQVSGKNHTTFTKMMRLDVAYVRRRSPTLDLIILLRTVWAVARS